MKVLGICGSPRVGQFSYVLLFYKCDNNFTFRDSFLDVALNAAAAKGAVIEKVQLQGKKIGGCIKRFDLLY